MVEVEQLLEPEEREILQQNVTPNLEKIPSIYSMDKLVENGCDIDFLDKDGFTALHKAIIGEKEPVIGHLLRKGSIEFENVVLRSLSGNRLSGPIPTEIGDIASLEDLVLENNQQRTQ
ncbi:hypothetical protein TSUD_56810 [Trifolium subterraneum]|uniref:Uncharacterized protein n=1 Tax=Trifolium subterraneum TaxID=3900 RepID=A0A2Z6N3B6_TRISU|nr:hypothetical protein TSUD_56810 [Trifolium subterraneum]